LGKFLFSGQNFSAPPSKMSSRTLMGVIAEKKTADMNNHQ